jgi:hypothetical protein
MKEKIIVAVWGHANQGKSETIRNMTTLLRAVSGAQVEVLFDGADIKIVITIGKIIIGVESQGDPGSRLEESVNDFAANYKCDIIICASRTRGDTVHIVETVADDYGYGIIWVTNHRSGEHQDALNQLSAEQLLALVQRMMDGTL